MKSYRGRPLIEDSDSPLTVDRALHASVGYWNQHMPPDQADAWPKQAADAWGAVEDGFGINGDQVFRPDGDAVLFVKPDDLALALVAYGCELIDKQDPNANAEIVAINGLLKETDRIKQTS